MEQKPFSTLELSKWFNYLKEKNNWDNTALGNYLGLDRGRISRVLRAKRGLQTTTIYGICNRLNMSIENLTKEIKDANIHTLH